MSFGYKESVLALLVGLVLLLLLPHPWNGVGFATAMASDTLDGCQGRADL
jgi:hypothetical protein